MRVKGYSHVPQTYNTCIKITNAFTEGTKKIRLVFFSQETYLLMMKKPDGCTRN
jgi:hypothetical protein